MWGGKYLINTACFLPQHHHHQSPFATPLFPVGSHSDSAIVGPNLRSCHSQKKLPFDPNPGLLVLAPVSKITLVLLPHKLLPAFPVDSLNLATSDPVLCSSVSIWHFVVSECFPRLSTQPSTTTLDHATLFQINYVSSWTNLDVPLNHNDRPLQK